MKAILLISDCIFCTGLGVWLINRMDEKLSVLDKNFDIKVAGVAILISLITVITFYSLFVLILSIK